MRALVLAVLLVVVSGCTQAPVKTISEPKRIIHPELPAPVSSYAFEWKVVVIDDKNVVIGLSYDQSIDFKIFLEDVKRYISESNVILCSYRKDLKENRCTKAIDK